MTTIKLTTAEVSGLWFTYIANTMSRCMTTHFLSHVDDPEVKKVLDVFMKVTVDNIKASKELMIAEEFPVPVGFGDEDVNPEAPRLFSDNYYMHYLRLMSGLGALFYTIVFHNTAREDIRVMFADMIKSTIDLTELVTALNLEKGTFVRPPFMPYPEPSFVTEHSFLNGFFGEKRTLSSMEITQLYTNIQFNEIENALLLGFAQVARDSDLRKYFLRGKDINDKQIDRLAKVLKQEDILVSIPSSIDITASQQPPYSDRLMLFHVTNLSSAKLRNFGDGISLSPRHDLSALYLKLMAETGEYAEDGTNKQIERGWMERIPQMVDRRELAERKG